MLGTARQEEIVKLIQQKQSLTVQELVEIFSSSESTIRRDIAQLDKLGLLKKVFGGAVSLENRLNREASMEEKSTLNLAGKSIVAQKAAALICAGDFIFLDAGSTTALMMDYLPEIAVKFATNGLSHGKKLADLGFETTLIGGTVKSATQAVIGGEAIQNLQKFHFTKGFFGANGVHAQFGFTTPDSNEAATKSVALGQCEEKFILADRSKEDVVSGTRFCDFDAAILITE